MDTATYQVKKKGAGGFTVSYDCPHCASALNWPLTDAGTSQRCPTCTKSSIVPGKANLEWLKAKEEADRRKAEQARQQELQKAEEDKRQAEGDNARAGQPHDAEGDVAVDESRLAAFWKTHCPYCFEEIKEGAKKCKSCCEYLDEALRTTATTQDVVRIRPPLADVFWLVAKFWAVSLLLAFGGYLIYRICGGVIAGLL